MALQRQRVTLDEFERILALPQNRNRLLELVDGEIVEKMPTEKHGELAAWIASLLLAHVRPHKLGRVGVEVRHQLETDDKHSYLPDVSFIAGERPSIEQGAVPRMPDLAVEVKSPDDSDSELMDKAHYYLANGSRMVWNVNYKQRTITVVTADEQYTLKDGDLLDGGDVLPGFQIPVSKVFEE